MRLIVEGGVPLVGSVEVPADKSIMHRALMLGALADGETIVQARTPGDDNLSTAAALRALGVEIQHQGDTWIVNGVGTRGLKTPAGPLDCGNSGTSMRLLAGMLAGAGLSARLSGDASLSRRPMGRVCKPLRSLGASISGQCVEQRELPPLVVTAGGFCGGHCELKVASAQLKSALLLAGVTSGCAVEVREPHLSRDHSERMLTAMGVGIEREQGTAGHTVRLPANAQLQAQSMRVPGDFSSAAFLLAAGLTIGGSELQIENVGVNPTRTGLLELLERLGERLGAAVSMEDQTIVAGEPVATLRVQSMSLDVTETDCRPTLVHGDIIPRLIDELVVLAPVACRAAGGVEVQDAQELRIKESDRIQETVRLLEAFGIACTERHDGYVVAGPQDPQPATVDVSADHRLAMTGAVLALAAPGRSVLEGFEIATVSFPGFVDALRALGARLEVTD